MNKKELEDIKTELEQEKARLELELTDIGKINSVDHHDWTGNAGDYEVGTADKNILADAIEEATTNDGITDELEIRLMNVNKAIERMNKEGIGKCEKCGNVIPAARLKANAAATTCVDCAD